VRVRPFSEAYHLLRPYLVYLQVKDAVAATGETCPRATATARSGRRWPRCGTRASRAFVSIEPHLAQAGRYGGYSGPEGFTQAAQALKSILNDLAIPYH